LTVAIALICLLTSSGLALPGVSVSAGILLEPPNGFYAYNLYPTLSAPVNGRIYVPNFVPGFQVGLTNISLRWESGVGYAHIGYSVGPWRILQVAMPHMAVGPQCCNFNETPHTQENSQKDWGNHYHSSAGFLYPGVNEPNYNLTDFSRPAYVGLRTDWQWVVSVSLDWKAPKLLRPENEWATVGIVGCQYVPSAPQKLVYTVVNFWMDHNSSSMFANSSNVSSERHVASPYVVIYHPIQLSDTNSPNETIGVELSPYLEDTLNALGFASTSAEPPVISYVYLNIEGYNMQWNTTLYSFFVMSDHAPSVQKYVDNSNLYYTISILIASVITTVSYLRLRKRM
jgi:hypothetical protein